jgi:hypothetical protein
MHVRNFVIKFLFRTVHFIFKNLRKRQLVFTLVFFIKSHIFIHLNLLFMDIPR